MLGVLRAYRDRHGRPALELPASGASHLVMLLQQRGLQPTDADRPAAVAVFETYAALLDEGLAGPASAGPVGWVNDLADGRAAVTFTPDWRVKYLDARPDLAGRLRMIPLPVFAPGEARTAVWGGTALAIPATAADPDAAWALLDRLAFSGAARSSRAEHTHILPADAEAWADFDRPHPLFGGQSVGALYADLADEVPRRVVTPATPAAAAALPGRVAAHRR